MMMEYYQLKTQILAERSRVNKEKDQVSESTRKELNSGLKVESKTPMWTKRTLEKRLKRHSQIGYASDHFEMIDRIKNVQAILFRAFQDESSKEHEKNMIGMCKMSSAILQNVQIQRQLILDTPFIARIKEELDKTKNELRKAKKSQVNKPFDRNDYPQSALIIDPDSIAGKPQETTPEEREADRPVF